MTTRRQFFLAGAAIGAFGISPARLRGEVHPTVTPKDYLSGGQLDAIARGRAVPDIVNALRGALRSLASGTTLTLPSGTILLPSTALGGHGLAVPPGVRIAGKGKQETRLVVTGSRACRLFVAYDASGTAFTDFSLFGNSVSVGETVGAGIVVTATRGMVIEGPRIERVHLENFAAPGWIHVISRQNAHVSRLAIVDLSAKSRPGNSLRPDLISHNAAVIRIDGFDGKLSEISIARLVVDAEHIKSAIAAYGAIDGIHVSDCRVADAGKFGARDDAGAYALQFYSAGRDMRDVSVLQTEIVNPRSCGIYATSIYGLRIADVCISGQSDLSDGTLPKGGIALNGTRHVQITRAKLLGNRLGVSITSPQGGDIEAAISLSDCKILECEKAGLFVRASRQRGKFSGLSLVGCEITSKGPGIAVRNSPAAVFDRIEVSECRIVSDTRGIDLYQDTPTRAYSARVSGSYVRGASSALRARHAPARVELIDSELISVAGRPAIDLAAIAALSVHNSNISSMPSRETLRIRGVLQIDLG